MEILNEMITTWGNHEANTINQIARCVQDGVAMASAKEFDPYKD
jgi:hypothetical protein